jgi:hypothetical protein
VPDDSNQLSTLQEMQDEMLLNTRSQLSAIIFFRWISLSFKIDDPVWISIYDCMSESLSIQKCWNSRTMAIVTSTDLSGKSKISTLRV